MSSIVSRARSTSLPNLLAWRALGFRTICSGRLGFAPSDPASPARAGTKILESFKEEFEVGSQVITLETGKIARFANGSVVLGMDQTKVLSTVTCAKTNSPGDFLPLTVDYQEKQYAQGLIPNSYMRREGAPKERELLCGRLIDRPIRPLFPPGFYHEVQIMASVLSSDGTQDPDILAANAASTALMLSDIPWGGPIGVIRLGRIYGQIVVNPTMDELSASDLNLIYACTRDKTMMIDVQAREISEKDLAAALRLAHPEAVKYIDPQIRLAAKAGKEKKEYKLSMLSEKILEKVTDLASTRIESVFTDPSYGKFERGEALDDIGKDVKKVFEEEGDQESLSILPKAVDTVRKKVVRSRMISDGFRVDGRHLDEVRPIFCESHHLPILHGSALFSRGDTQVLCAVTLGALGDAQSLDSLVGSPKKRFMLHYSFPPYCTNEVGKRGGLNRREVGHGTLAEKALLAVLPPEEVFPFTVRINSEVMSSDGSTSMASVCGGSMALMDAGIPLRAHVAGVSVGLVTDVDPSSGEIKDYRIVTDILGLEDHLGDMDFKIAGTRNGVTAIQLDIKPAGIPLDIVCESLDNAREARLQILDHMEREINSPRVQDVNSPRLVTLRYTNDALRSLIGPMGVVKRKIEEETGARLYVDDGRLTIVAKKQAVMEKALEKVDFIIGREIVVGAVYKGTVTSIKEYGAFVEFNGGQHGLLHLSELSHEPVSKVSDVLHIGKYITMMCIDTDVRGNIKLSLKALLPKPERKSASNPERKPVVKESSTVSVETSSVGEVVASMPSVVEPPQKSKLAVPAVVIRTAVECDEAEKSSPVDKITKPKRAATVKPDRKLKFTASKQAGTQKEEEALESTTPEEIPAKFGETLKQDEKLKSTFANLVSSSKTKKSARKEKQPEKEGEESASISARELKIGTEMTAKVQQVRARGLVLDLGGGIRGMYKFEGDEETEFEIGDSLKVKCTSFSSKGIPVMALVEDEEV